jgi:hypothetical protein
MLVKKWSVFWSNQSNPEINQSKRKRINARCQFDFDVSALRKKMIIENTFQFGWSRYNKIYLEFSLR